MQNKTFLSCSQKAIKAGFLVGISSVISLLSWPMQAAVGDKYNIGAVQYTVETENPETLTGTISAKHDPEKTVTGNLDILSSIATPEGYNYNVTVLTNNAFKDCSHLTSVTIPDTVITIGYSAFQGCTSLTNASLGHGVKIIEGTWYEGAFAGCTSLTSIVIPDNVQTMGTETFSKCTGLKEITLGSGLSAIGKRLFMDCTNLSEIQIPDTIQAIEEFAFQGCTGLTNIVIPDGVKSIGKAAFQNCSNLNRAIVGSGVTTFSYDNVYGVFTSCPALTSVFFRGNIPSVSGNVFQGSLSAIVYYVEGTTGWRESWNGRSTKIWSGCGWAEEDGIEYIYYEDGRATIMGYTAPEANIEIPETITVEGHIYIVTTIADRAFKDCEPLVTMELPASVTVLGKEAFSGCNSLEAIYFWGDAPTAGEGLFTNANPELIVYYIEGTKNWVSPWCGRTAQTWKPDPFVTELRIDGANHVYVGTSETYTCIASYSDGTSLVITPTWSTDNNCASINVEGILTAILAGDVTVTAVFEEKSAHKMVTISTGIAPTISTQPVSQSVNEGDKATLSVITTGTAPMHYQWMKNGAAISGATNSLYTINTAQASDAGDYTVTISNKVGSVTSDVATLTVIVPVRESTATRSASQAGKSAIVTLDVIPAETVGVYFIEEEIPAIATVSNISDGGVFSESKGIIRWSFLDKVARKITYNLRVASDYSVKLPLKGNVTFDETSMEITGVKEIDFGLLTHPADMNEEFEIETGEVAAYALAWTKGQDWPREPIEIPVSYLSRAALIWLSGGNYFYDSTKTTPQCWISTEKEATSIVFASGNTNVRSIAVDGPKATVSLKSAPNGTSIYFVEERISTGANYTISDISNGGNYIASKNAIRWMFLDNQERTLSYVLSVSDEYNGSVGIQGEVTFDEESLTTEGDSQAVFKGKAAPVINATFYAGLVIQGTVGATYVIEYSTDNVTWVYADEVTLTETIFYWPDVKSYGQSKRFYRAKVKE